MTIISGSIDQSQESVNTRGRCKQWLEQDTERQSGHGERADWGEATLRRRDRSWVKVVDRLQPWAKAIGTVKLIRSYY